MKNYFEGTQSEALANEMALVMNGYKENTLYVPSNKPAIKLVEEVRVEEVPNLIKKRNVRLKNAVMKEDNIYYNQALEMTNASRKRRNQELLALEAENLSKQVVVETVKESAVKSFFKKVFKGGK